MIFSFRGKFIAFAALHRPVLHTFTEILQGSLQMRLFCCLGRKIQTRSWWSNLLEQSLFALYWHSRQALGTPSAPVTVYYRRMASVTELWNWKAEMLREHKGERSQGDSHKICANVILESAVYSWCELKKKILPFFSYLTNVGAYEADSTYKQDPLSERPDDPARAIG